MRTPFQGMHISYGHIIYQTKTHDLQTCKIHTRRLYPYCVRHGRTVRNTLAHLS